MASADVCMRAFLASPTTTKMMDAGSLDAALTLLATGPPPGLALAKQAPNNLQLVEPSAEAPAKVHVCSGKSGAQRRKRRQMRKIVSQKRYCSVWQDPQLQCAIVRLSSASLRTALLAKLNDGLVGDVAFLNFGGVVATVKAHFDWQLNQDVVTELFVQWQPSITLASPTAEAIAEKIDTIMAEIVKLADVSEFAPDVASLPKINLA
eukprot:TRINITY_DN66948_c0_g1_i1.p1 TRINITY_DN66948_c0_g1~~TRINITY_DN66948_c0_g1_i1.p1  ORF type:complete len:225 (+),score=41.08 TRINITY_DN66948_c0_g1_i1:56-676(+)